VKLRRILLVQPQTSFDNTSSAAAAKSIPFLTFKSGFAPLALLTVAALTPSDIELQIWDEDVSGQLDEEVLARGWDLVGVTGYYNHLPRIIAIGQLCRRQGIRSAAGGPGVSAEPGKCRGLFDHLFIGEAEFTWPQFIADILHGRAQREYRQVEKPDLGESPIPSFELLPRMAQDYAMGAVQSTRGCPFDCEFCDVIYLFGRKPRHKPIDRIVEEMRRLERLGVRRVSINDDNFIGRPAYAKDLLRKIIEANRTFRRPLSFFTSLTLNVARDDELLQLLSEANFWQVLIGIESANPESLRETQKVTNYKTDMLRDIHKIHSYGISIQGSFVVGFDHDGPEVLENSARFLQDSAIPLIPLNILVAPPGTKLWTRLRKENRVVDLEHPDLNQHVGSNITFKQMSREQLFETYIELSQRLYTWKNVQERMLKMISQLRWTPRRAPRMHVVLWEEHRLILGLIKFIFLNNDKELRQFFLTAFGSVLRRSPYMFERILLLTIATVSFRNYAHSAQVNIKALIEHEKHHPPRILLDDGWIRLPESFQRDYRKVFPSVHRYLSERLADKARLNDALIEVFADFIQRFSKEYDGFTEQLLGNLGEICDRTVARLNGQSAVVPLGESAAIRLEETEAAGPAGTGGASTIRRLRLDDEIFKAVEQEILSEKQVAQQVRLINWRQSDSIYA
jgi:radical SAM superfamily enzyme YgiQ (UPF0313 family)